MPTFTDDVQTTGKFITGAPKKSNGEIDLYSRATRGEHIPLISIINDNGILKIVETGEGEFKRVVPIMEINPNDITLALSDGEESFNPTVIINGNTSQISTGSVLIDGNANQITILTDDGSADFIVLDGNTNQINAGSVLIDGNAQNIYMRVSYCGSVLIDGNALQISLGYSVLIDGRAQKIATGCISIDGSANQINMGGSIFIDGSNSKINLCDNVLIDGMAGDVILQNGDCAEDFEISPAEQVNPGTVMVLNDDGKLVQSKHPYDKRVAGVVSGAGDLKPGLVLGRQSGHSDRVPIALMGRVNCKIDASYASIEVGDLLTSSPTCGHAMKAEDPGKAFGAVIGKALKPLKAGCDLIPILVALQ